MTQSKILTSRKVGVLYVCVLDIMKKYLIRDKSSFKKIYKAGRMSLSLRFF